MKIGKWVKRICLGTLMILCILLVVGFAWEQLSRSRALAQSSDGDMLDVGGHRLHFLKKGQGGPTVVFESGLDGAGHLVWFKVQQEIAQLTTTISYDRAGILWSERGSNPKTGSAIAGELAALLDAGNFPKPYILVGHSLAGLTLKSFVAEYGVDVAGVVLVDASHSEQMARFPDDIKAEMEPPPSALIRFANEVGLLRLLMASTTYPSTQATDPLNTIGKQMFFNRLDAFMDEANGLDALIEETLQITSFGQIPLVVISGAAPEKYADVPDERQRQQFTEIWAGLQTDLLKLSSDSQQVIALKSGHYVQLDQPELVVSAIKEVMAKAGLSEDLR